MTPKTETVFDDINNLYSINYIVDTIIMINPDRHYSNLNRRMLKLIEELGEVSEAYLGVTSQQNRKGKSWHDVREEIIDCYIVLIDCLWTKHEGETLSDTMMYNREDQKDCPCADVEDFLRTAMGIWAEANTYLQMGAYLDFYETMKDFEALIWSAVMLSYIIDEDRDWTSGDDLENEIVEVVKKKLTKWANNVGGVITQSNNAD